MENSRGLDPADKCVSAAYSISPMNVPISVSSLTNFPSEWERDHQWPNMQMPSEPWPRMNNCLQSLTVPMFRTVVILSVI